MGPEWKKKAIGPDDWYNDDFNYDQTHSFSQDPLLNHQYGQLLDLRYQSAAMLSLIHI